jgi:F-type H+-transporting ATPase subunit alpha
MDQTAKSISDILQKQISLFEPEVTAHEAGFVAETGDGIARVRGLSHVRSQELVQFAEGTLGIAFNLEAETIGVIILGENSRIEEGMEVRATGRIASVPVGDALIGRVVNALGEPVDGKGPVRSERYLPVERIAPRVVERQDVDTPVQTGLKAIDSMIPIGRGQRELIIGDRQTGKSAIAIDTIINQKGKGLVCIYVAIGQKKSSVARTVATFERYGAMEHTVVVIAAADEPAAMQYIAPYAGCAIGEDFGKRPRRADRLRRPFQARLGLPPGVAPSAPAAGPLGVSGRRVLPPLAAAGTRGAAGQPLRDRAGGIRGSGVREGRHRRQDVRRPARPGRRRGRARGAHSRRR